jgi:pyrroline-5-carboxylate reductase
MTDVSVIGCGNMGGALVRGLADAGGYRVTACDLDEAAREAVAPYCERTTADLDEAARATTVVVAVKPSAVGAVLDGLALDADQTLVTIAAGVPTALVAPRTAAGVVRVMPNLAAEFGAVAAAMAPAADADDDDVARVRALFDDVGEVVEVDESLMDAATALNGSGPAFVFYLIGATADAAVDEGMTPDDAERLAAQTFKGAAETVLRSERSVDDLIDAVCSPNGTTIEGMEVLWDGTADEDVAAALAAAAARSRELAEEAS